MKTSLALLGASIAVAVGTAYGQIVTVTYNFGTTGSTTLAGAISGAGSAGISSASNFGNGGVLTTLGFVTGVSGQARSAEGWATATTFSSASTAFWTFTITPAAGYSLNLDSVAFQAAGNNQRPTSYTVTSSLDSHVAAIAGTGSTGSIGTTFANKSVTLPAAFDNLTTAITFRIYGFNAQNGQGKFNIDDVVISGSVTATPVPEPEEYAALAGMALIGFGAWRRWSARKA